MRISFGDASPRSAVGGGRGKYKGGFNKAAGATRRQRQEGEVHHGKPASPRAREREAVLTPSRTSCTIHHETE